MRNQQIESADQSRLGFRDASEAEPATTASTPLPRPSPMPTQTIEFWTPRLLAATVLRSLAGVRPPASVSHAGAPAAGGDEAR